MSGAEVTYTDVKFSKSKSRDSQPADLSKIKKFQARLKKKPRVTIERVALLVLSVLLAAAIITLFTQPGCSQKKQENATSPPPPAVQKETFLQCEAGWEQDGRNCYYFNTTLSSWHESRSFCRNLGGDLVRIDSREEQMFLLGRLSNIKYNLTEKFWIGLVDLKEEGRWFWVDGSVLNESFWSDGQPGTKHEEKNSTRGQDCVRMGKRKYPENLKSWFDRSCRDPNSKICEKAAKLRSCFCQ